jgi:glutamine synthetase
MAGTLDAVINQEFTSLDQQGRTLVEYVWIGGSGTDLRSKTKVVDSTVTGPEDLPIWNYDGSSTAQAPGDNSEVLIKPVALFRDPFRRGSNLIALCSTYQPLDDGSMVPLTVHGDPVARGGLTGNNTRDAALAIFEDETVKQQEMWYGIEQEYTLFHADRVTPLGWPKGGFPGQQGPYYCSAGAENAFGRDIAESHLRACLYAGVKVSGINAEVMPGQWEYQVGPCKGIDSGDHLIISRYLMYRVCEKYNVVVSFEPKPIKGDWNGAGLHTNFSLNVTREEGGYEKIVQICEAFGKKCAEHIAEYGEDNDKRLTGKHETCSIHEFKYGVANRGASIRIPRETEARGRGYLEDRRPASNADPYRVIARMMRTAGEALTGKSLDI